MPLRRDELSQKAMVSQRGTFTAVMYETHIILRSTFGMELVELPTRTAAREASGAGPAGQDENQDKTGTQNGENTGEWQTVTGLKKKGALFHAFFFSPKV